MMDCLDKSGSILNYAAAMSLPTPLPTDNLYKLMAITGVLISLFSVVYPLTQAEKGQQEIFEVMRDSEIMKVKSDAKGSEADSLKAQVVDYQTRFKNTLDRAKADAIQDKISDLMAKESAALNEQVELIQTSSANVQYGTKMSQQRLTFLHYYLALVIVGTIAGSLLAEHGFGKWYNRVQKYQDYMIRSEAESKGYKDVPWVPPFALVFKKGRWPRFYTRKAMQEILAKDAEKANELVAETKKEPASN